MAPECHHVTILPTGSPHFHLGLFPAPRPESPRNRGGSGVARRVFRQRGSRYVPAAGVVEIIRRPCPGSSYRRSAFFEFRPGRGGRPGSAGPKSGGHCPGFGFPIASAFRGHQRLRRSDECGHRSATGRSGTGSGIPGRGRCEHSRPARSDDLHPERGIRLRARLLGPKSQRRARRRGRTVCNGGGLPECTHGGVGRDRAYLPGNRQSAPPAAAGGRNRGSPATAGIAGRIQV